MNTTIGDFTAENAEQSIKSLNIELAGMGKPPMKAATYEQTRKTIVEAEGFEMDYYRAVTNEDGSKEIKRYTTEQLNDDLKLGGKYEANAREAIANAEKTVDDATNEMLPYTVSSEDAKHVVSVENIGMLTGASLSQPYQDLLAKRAGVYIAPPKAKATSRMDTLQQRRAVEARIGELKNLVESSEGEQKAKYKELLRIEEADLVGRVGGKKEASENLTLHDLGKYRESTGKWREEGYAFEPLKVDKKTLANMEATESGLKANLSTEDKALVKDTTKQMRANKTTIESIDVLMQEVKAGKITPDKDIVANIANYGKRLVGITDEKAIANINWDTKSGMLLASYLRSTSGMAVTEGERDFLTTIMKGGALADEKSMYKAMEAFRQGLDTEQQSLGNTMFQNAPATATKLRQYKGSELTSHKEEQKVAAPSKANTEVKKTDTPEIKQYKTDFANKKPMTQFMSNGKDFYYNSNGEAVRGKVPTVDKARQQQAKDIANKKPNTQFNTNGIDFYFNEAGETIKGKVGK